MNRSALTIKMLNYLKAHDVVSRSELATYLETNIRNISEFKKELEVAGYCIDTVSGAYGGYRLDEDSLIPTLALNEEEIKALNDAQTYLNTHKFKYVDSFNAAMIKIKGNLKDPGKSNQLYFLGSSLHFKDDYNMTKIVEEARNNNQTLSFYYKKLNGIVWEERLVQPYEFINTEDGYYVLAYDVSIKKEKMFKHFKITKSRMRNLDITKKTFVRDVDFKIHDHVGKQGLIKEVYEIKLEVQGKQASLLNEIDIGLMTKKYVKDGILHLSFQMENKMRIIEFILSLGVDCKVVEPKEIKDEIISVLSKTLKQYVI